MIFNGNDHDFIGRVWHIDGWSVMEQQMMKDWNNMVVAWIASGQIHLLWKKDVRFSNDFVTNSAYCFITNY